MSVAYCSLWGCDLSVVMEALHWIKNAWGLGSCQKRERFMLTAPLTIPLVPCVTPNG